jgi:primary-amine oxidase
MEARIAGGIYPLSTLTNDELLLSVAVVRSCPVCKKDSIFDRVQLIPPTKSFVMAWSPGDPLKRMSYVCIYNAGTDSYYEFKITLGSTVSNSPYTTSVIPGARPAWTNVDNGKVVAALLKNPAYKTALSKRGITQAQIDVGQVNPNTLLDGRMDGVVSLIDMPNLEGVPRPRSWYVPTCFFPTPPDANTPYGNFYVYPLPGLLAWVDANGKPNPSLLLLNDEEVSPIISEPDLMNINYPPNPYASGYRLTQKPINMSMPQGPSWTYQNGWIMWENWKMFVSFDQNIGVILNMLQYKDPKLGWRMIAYQINVQEAITAYGNDEYGGRNENFLDFGEYQYRLYASNLDPSVDGVPYMNTYPVSFIDDTGSLITYPNAIGIYERPSCRSSWRHYDYATATVQGRAGRELVIETATTVGNYDYNVKFVFNLSGGFDFQVEASGMDEMIAGTEEKRSFTFLHKNILSSNHQHFFSLKVDWNVDGEQNRVYENNTVAVPSLSDGAWINQETLFNTSGDSARSINPLSGRTWSVVNKGKTDSLGHNPAYTIKVNTGNTRLANQNNRISKRTLQFTKNNIYVTRFKEDQPYFMGKFPVEKGVCEGVVNQDAENIVDKRIVMWVTNGFNHVPSSENWPILLTEQLSVSFEPDNFFIQNPAMNADINTNIDPTK